MKHLHFVLALFFGVSSAFAAHNPRLIVPADTTLRVRAVEHQHDLYAEFSGQLIIKGTLIAKWVRGVDESTANTLYVRIIPDESAKKSIPHFESYPVRRIELANERETLEMVLDKVSLAKLNRKELSMVRAKGKFTLEAVVMGVECDAPWMRAKLSRSRLSAPLRYSGKTEVDGCWNAIAPNP